MTATDPLLGPLLAIVYRDSPSSPSISTILIGRHGVSEHVNMTLTSQSRYFSACLNLPPAQRDSMVRRAIAIASLRTFSHMDPVLKATLTQTSRETQMFDWDETTAGQLASRMIPAVGKYPEEIGRKVLDSGVLYPKTIYSGVVDIVYADSPVTNDINNELVYLFGRQLEHLFDPLKEYSPEPTEMLYAPPTYPPVRRPADDGVVRSVCLELYSVQKNFANDLVKLLQDFLIPLRVTVLSGEIPGINMRMLNTIFPPTIDEIVRVNNIFFEALELALPYGSFEILKACGITIPYFYKACMRHEATTRNFAATLRKYSEALGMRGSRFSPHKIESIIHCSLHLTKIKMVLDRLVKLVPWREDEMPSVKEYYASAVGTIDSFGRESSVSPYDSRVFTASGKLLVELSKRWPKELEYGWINRRVVTIFDAQGGLVVVVFTDTVVVVKLADEESRKRGSGIHKPSVAHMMMHSMINSVPLQNLPELTVLGWAAIDDVYMAEFSYPENIAMYVTGDGFIKEDSVSHFELFKLTSTDEVTASTIVNYISKAKIMNKTQPFHLFLNEQENFATFATVQEIRCYADEARKCPIAIFANMNVTESMLDTHRLQACIGTQVYGPDHIAIFVVSKLSYSFQAIVSTTDFAAAVSSQVTRLYSLYFLSVTSLRVENNESLARNLINFAITRSPAPTKRRSVLKRISGSLLGRRRSRDVNSMISLPVENVMPKLAPDNNVRYSYPSTSVPDIIVPPLAHQMVQSNSISTAGSRPLSIGSSCISSARSSLDLASILKSSEENEPIPTPKITKYPSVIRNESINDIPESPGSAVNGVSQSASYSTISETHSIGEFSDDEQWSSEPSIDIGETTFDDYEDDDDDQLDRLSVSMRNITQFMDDSLEKPKSASPMPTSPTPHSESSVLLTDEFAYLASFVSGAETLPEIRENSVMFVNSHTPPTIIHSSVEPSVESLSIPSPPLPVPTKDEKSSTESLLHVGQQSTKHILSVSKSPSVLSSKELALRSLTVNIDSIIHQEYALLPAKKLLELEHVNTSVLKLYNSTSALPVLSENVKLGDKDKARIIEVENRNRQILMQCLWTLIGIRGRDSVVQDFLAFEYERRNTLREKMGSQIPSGLWGT